MRLLIPFVLLPVSLCSISRFYISPEAYYRDYHEVISGAAKSDEYGYLYGFEVGYENCFFLYYLHLFGNLSYGRTTYDGSIVHIDEGTVEPCLSSTDNRIYDLEADTGYSVYTNNKGVVITPLLGLGYHNWVREGEPNIEEDYDEEYSWLYCLVGLKTEKFFGGNKKLGFLAKGLYTNNASVEVSRVFPNAINLNLENRFQYYLKAYFQYFFKMTDVKLELFYKTENIGQSSDQWIQGYILSIPSSKTYAFGILLELGIRF